MKTKKRFIAFLFLLTFAFCAVSSANTYAAQGEGGGLGGSCDKSYWDNMGSGYGACTTDGYGWVYFKYDTTAKVDISFGPTSNAQGGAKTVSSECVDYGGFWHFGIYVRKNINRMSQSDVRFTTVSINGGTAIGNPQRGSVSRGIDDKLNAFTSGAVTLSHTFFDSNGNQIAHAARVESDREVSDHYQDWLRASGQPNIWNSSLSWFCWNENMSETGFTGSVSATVGGTATANGGTKTISNGSTTIVFTHKIKRSDAGTNDSLTNHYYTTVSGDGGSALGSASNKSSKNFLKNQEQVVRTDTIPVSLNYGETKTFCQTLHYDSSVKDDNTPIATADTGQYCVTVTRPTGGNFSASQSCSVNAAGQHKGNECDKEYATNSRNWTISHTSTVNKNASGTVQAGMTGTTANGYSHSSLSYGVANTKCVQSYSPYTNYKYDNNGVVSSGITTLIDTGTKDLGSTFSGNNKYWDGVTTHDSDECNRHDWRETTNGTHVKVGNSYVPKQAGQTGTHSYVCVEYKQLPTYSWHIPGCDDGTTTWRNWGNNSRSTTWNQGNSGQLILGATGDTVSIRKYSGIKELKTNYSSGSWSGSGSVSGWNTITRYRRYVHFTGTSTIKADSGHKNAATTSVNNGDTINVSNDDGKFTVTFTYQVNRTTTDNVKDSGAENFTVSNQWKSKETIAATDNSDQTYAQNGTYNQWHSYPNFNTTNANRDNSGTKTQTVTGTLYYGQEVKVCGNINYGDIVRELENGSEVHHPTTQEVGCVKIKRNEGTCGNVVPAGNSSYFFSHQKGDNVAKIGVTNITSGMTSPLYTTWSYGQGRVDGVDNAVGIWARPGDNIKYQIEYCMGASYGNVVHRANNINDGASNVNTKLYMSGDSAAPNPTDTAKVPQNKRSNYLFGDEVSSYNSTTSTTTPTTFNFVKFNTNGTLNEADSLVNLIGSKTSPSSSAGTRYTCPIGDGASGNSGYYQIAGKVINKTGNYDTDNYVIDGCDTNRTQALDVGRELNERLMWTSLRVKTVNTTEVKADYASKAFVRIPYNYVAKPYIGNKSLPNGTVQVGGKFTTQPGIAVFPRTNCAMTGNFSTASACSGDTSRASYATVTKPTTVKYTTYIDNKSNIVKQETVVVRANTKSNPLGSTADGVYVSGNLNAGGPNMDSQYIVDVPNNANPGQKICVEMTITPADSHNNPSKSEVMGASINFTTTENTRSKNGVWWGLRDDNSGLTQFEQSSATATSCSTIVKRPMISVEDSNLYTATSVATSVITRKNNNNFYLYGSWSEYGIFGKVVTGSSQDSVSTLLTGSGASLGYDQRNNYGASHSQIKSGYAAQPLLVVKYNGGANNGIHNYNYKYITKSEWQTRITYDYVTKEDGSHEYQLKSKIQLPIQPQQYVYAAVPIINAGNNESSASKDTTICVHATQTFANVDCDNGSIGANGIGNDAAEVFTSNILDRYSSTRLAKTETKNAPKYTSGSRSYVDFTSMDSEAKQFGNEGSTLYKYIDGDAYLGYTNGNDFNLNSYNIENRGTIEGFKAAQPIGSTIVYRARNVVIGSSIIANEGQKHGLSDFKMPIIIADKVWLTGTPKQIDAIIITNELNTCKWANFNSFQNNKTIVMSGTNANLNSQTCTNEIRFTAPVIVKGKVILNRTHGAGGGEDQARRAEIFELNAATYLWTYNEMSRYNQATTTYSRELPSRY